MCIIIIAAMDQLLTGELQNVKAWSTPQPLISHVFLILFFLLQSLGGLASNCEEVSGMRFSSCITALAIGAGIASSAHHSARSLQHVGKRDLPYKSYKRETPRQIQQRSDSFQYLTNTTASKFLMAPTFRRLLTKIPRILGQWYWNSRREL
jgi:hypothetical protein